MADSIRLPDSDVTLYAGVKSFKIDAEKKILRLPLEIAKDLALTDRVVETVKEYARAIAQGDKPKLEDFENLLSQKIGAHEIATNEAKVLFESANTMAELIKLKKDTVWAFILKNIYKPLFLQKEKFDIVIGNPPWLLYRYVESVDYQAFLKKLIMKDYGLLGSERAEVITEMELATLFFVRTSDLYLARDGTISFVMPRGIFVSDQHYNFRKGSFTPKMAFEEFLDLEGVNPLFRVPSCVITAKRGTNRYPVDTVVFRGDLPQKNSRLNQAVKTLVQTKAKFEFYEIGQRSFLASQEFRKALKAIDQGHRSHYYESFTQGATIVPRSVWFVEPVVHQKLGIDPTKPRLRTSQRATDNAKEEYADVQVEGEVESEFLYQVVTGSELAPFCTTTLPIVILPIELSGGAYRIIKSDEAQRRGYSGLRGWLVDCERIWKEKRGEKTDRIDLYAWLNYQNKLTSQSSRMKYKVLYNTSGTYLVSCIVENGSSKIKVDSSQIRVTGVIADMTTCRFDTNDYDEALFV